MYQEYAIDPEGICRSWERFRFIWYGLGFDKGRLLSRYPGKWQKAVIESKAYKELPEIKRTTIFEKLKREKEEKRRITASGRDYDKSKSTWVGAALSAHQLKPFHAIISDESESNTIFAFDDIDGENDCWTVSTPWLIERRAKVMAGAVCMLLQSSREIRFIDPHFSFKKRFTTPLKEFMDILKNYSDAIKNIEIHLGHLPSRGEAVYFLKNFQEEEARKRHFYLPEGADDLIPKITFYIWKSHENFRMHPRYILTEVGGLKFDHGLDEAPNTPSFTDVDPMSAESISKRLAEYTESSTSDLLLKFTPRIN